LESQGGGEKEEGRKDCEISACYGIETATVVAGLCNSWNWSSEVFFCFFFSILNNNILI